MKTNIKRNETNRNAIINYIQPSFGTILYVHTYVKACLLYTY